MSEKNREEKQPKPIHLSEQTQNEISFLFEEIGDEQERKQKYMEWAKKNLERTLGITDLTTIEGVHLRNTIEQLMPKIENDRRLVLEGEMSAMNLAEMEEEAPALWLNNLYGIHPKDIPFVVLIEDETEQKEYKYESAMKEEAKKKDEELTKQGHNVYSRVTVPEDFKEYVRRLRERSHHESE